MELGMKSDGCGFVHMQAYDGSFLRLLGFGFLGITAKWQKSSVNS
jgi:hypothetical protein